MTKTKLELMTTILDIESQFIQRRGEKRTLLIFAVASFAGMAAFLFEVMSRIAQGDSPALTAEWTAEDLATSIASLGAGLAVPGMIVQWSLMPLMSDVESRSVRAWLYAIVAATTAALAVMVSLAYQATGLPEQIPYLDLQSLVSLSIVIGPLLGVNAFVLKTGKKQMLKWKQLGYVVIVVLTIIFVVLVLIEGNRIQDIWGNLPWYATFSTSYVQMVVFAGVILVGVFTFFATLPPQLPLDELQKLRARIPDEPPKDVEADLIQLLSKDD